MGKTLKTPEELQAKLAAKKTKEQKVEAKVEKTEAPKEEVKETPAIKTADLKAVKKVEPVSVRKVDLVQLAISNASLTVWWFTFKKGEKIAITWRNKKIIEKLLESKKVKIVK